MNNLFLYIVWSGSSLLIMYGFYYFFLRKETCFSCIRFYLLFSLILSILIPFVPDLLYIQNFIPENISLTLKSVTINPENTLFIQGQKNQFGQVLIWFYLSGIVISFLRLLIHLSQVFILIRKTGISRNYDINVVYTGKRYSNFSFFNIVFLNNSSNNGDEINQIIKHEKIHISQKHYLDLLIIELLTIVFWFNPIIWLYKHSIKTTHEFLADEGVLATGYHKEKYQKLLLNQTFGFQLYPLTNNFNPVRKVWPVGQSLIKRRFTMMTKQKRKSQTIFKTLLGIPLIMLIAFVISCNSTVSIEEPKSSLVINEEPELYEVVEEMPVFIGGEEARIKYLVENIKYPKEARENGINGRVLVSFVVEETGDLTDVKIQEGIGGGCDKEAVRVIKNMPKWESGKQKGKKVRVQFHMPITFKLN